MEVKQIEEKCMQWLRQNTDVSVKKTATVIEISSRGMSTAVGILSLLPSFWPQKLYCDKVVSLRRVWWYACWSMHFKLWNEKNSSLKLDRLIRTGILLDQLYRHSFKCSPSRSTLFAVLQLQKVRLTLKLFKKKMHMQRRCTVFAIL